MADLSDYDWYEPSYAESHKDIRSFEWTCKDGRKIPIGKMTDGHLLSAYKKKLSCRQPTSWKECRSVSVPSKPN
jgi:hypothetical protein